MLQQGLQLSLAETASVYEFLDLMSTSFTETVSQICLAAVAYNYVGYPLLLFIMSVLFQAKADFVYLNRRVNRRCLPSSKYVPRVALLISAYNEALVIEAKVQNCVEIEYPSERLDFWFGLDAPTDSTAELLKRVPTSHMHVLTFPRRRGKLAVLCDLARRTQADILVLTDANTMLDRNCIRNMVRHFSDPQVGAVSGEEVRTVVEGTDPGAESIYWRYESAIKILESRLNCSQGGNGAALAVRSSLFRPRSQSIVEDFQIPLEIRFKGFRVVYDPEAIATEEIPTTFTAQFVRRVRIGAGNYQTLLRNPRYLNPMNGLLTFTFISHRVLRWLGPLFLLTAFFCSIAMAVHSKFGAVLALQCVFYSTALIGYASKKRGRSAGWFAAPLNFCCMNLALLMGLYTYLTGRQGATWSATPRASQPAQHDGSMDGEGQKTATAA